MPLKSRLGIHKTQDIILNGTKVHVDEDLVHLILELSRLGLQPVNCCQGGTNGCEHAYISLLLDKNSYFEYDADARILTIRWNRTGEDFLSVSPHVYKGKQIIKIEDICAAQK